MKGSRSYTRVEMRTASKTVVFEFRRVGVGEERRLYERTTEKRWRAEVTRTGPVHFLSPREAYFCNLFLLFSLSFYWSHFLKSPH